MCGGDGGCPFDGWHGLGGGGGEQEIKDRRRGEALRCEENGFQLDTYDDPMHLSINFNTNEHEEVVIKDIMLQR